MKIGVPKEIKNNENRVAVTPSGVLTLVNAGHEVFIERGAGLGSGISDDEFTGAGAGLVTAEEAWGCEMVIKVKEPLEAEYQYFRPDLLLFTYLHLAAEPDLTRALLDNQVNAVAYETVLLPDGTLPLLIPMSEVAGRRSVLMAAIHLEKHRGGLGILPSGVAGTERAKFVIIGAGAAGTNAAQYATGLGADVTILDVNLSKLRALEELYGNRIKTLYSNEMNIAQTVKDADAVISTVLIPGAKAPKLIKEYMVKSMKKGSVIVDISIDQGGSVETIDRITTHDQPVFEKFGVIHYAVANMPGATPRTSTFALANATLPYALKLAKDGCEACGKDFALMYGLNTFKGKCMYKAVAEAHGLDCFNAKSELERKVM